jgi:hypothetical protein
MDRKEYNKKYYAEKKKEICQKLFVKVDCTLCGRTVTHQNMKKHMKSNYCKLRQERGKPKQDILSELEIIKLELVELKKQSTKPTEDPVVYCCGCGETFKESEKSNHKCKQTAKPICKLNI